MTEYFPGVHKALGLSSSITRRYEQEKEGREEGGRKEGKWECWTRTGCSQVI